MSGRFFYLHIGQNYCRNEKHREVVAGVNTEEFPGFLFPRDCSKINWKIETQPRKDRCICYFHHRCHLFCARNKTPRRVIVGKDVCHKEIADNHKDHSFG